VRWLAPLAVVVAACASTPPLLLGRPVTKPVAVLLRVSDDAANTDELGGTLGITEAVTGGLTERGVANQLYAADDDHPLTPRIEIWVLRWDPGERGVRAGLGGISLLVTPVALGTPLADGDYTVVCRVYREGEAQPALNRRYSGVIAGTDEDSSNSLGESVGRRILADAFDQTHQTHYTGATQGSRREPHTK